MLSEDEKTRYARQLLIPGWDIDIQEKVAPPQPESPGRSEVKPVIGGQTLLVEDPYIRDGEWMPMHRLREAVLDFRKGPRGVIDPAGGNGPVGRGSVSQLEVDGVPLVVRARYPVPIHPLLRL